MNMKNNQVLSFDFFPAADAARRNDGWGSGMLLLNHKPYWFSGTENAPQAVEWTWVDLLEHLASVWGALMAEQTYPFAWLKDATHPEQCWAVAERRWAGQGEATANLEEPVLLAFERRHNLAAAWKGIGLPALTWLRVGKTVWLYPESGEPIRASFDECRKALLALGNQLESACQYSSNPRVAAAVNAWRNKGEVLEKNFLELVTGFTSEQLKQLQKGQSAEEYWDIPAHVDWDAGEVPDRELLAAARMTSGILDVSVFNQVAKQIRKLKKSTSFELEKWTSQTLEYVARRQASFSFESGYHAAEFIKDKLPAARMKYVDIQALLQKLNITLVEMDMVSDKLDAIAVWGGRGPCIILNTSRAYADDQNRTRMTLAHELCHLLLDRQGGLPFCEVLGGKTDGFIEQRAYAFAAELLLPRALVAQELKELKLWRGTHREFIQALSQKYAVSKTVVCAQLKDSTVFDQIDRPTQDYVKKRLLGQEGPLAFDNVRSDKVRFIRGVV